MGPKQDHKSKERLGLKARWELVLSAVNTAINVVKLFIGLLKT